MVLYWDLIIGSTILVNYSFLKTIMIAFRQKVIWWRMIIALVFCTLSLSLFVLPSFLTSVRYLLGIMIGVIAFPSRRWKELTVQISCFYLLNLAFIGGLMVFNLHNTLFLFICLAYIIFLFLIDKKFYYVLKNKALTYNVNILGLSNNLFGYYDTGNRSKYKHLPIVFLDDKFHTDYFTYHASHELIGLSGKKIVDLYQGGLIMINKQVFEVYYAFLSLLEYDLILNYHMEVDHD